MAFKRSTFTITADDFGNGYDDVTLHIPTSGSREARFNMVRLDRDSGPSYAGAPTFTFTERTDVSAETWNPTPTVEPEEYGMQLAHIDLRRTLSTLRFGECNEFDFRHPVSVAASGEDPIYDVVVGQQLIKSRKVRCEVTNALPGDIFTVYMYVDSPGDYRF